MLFDEWPDRYDNWFTSPIGKLVKFYETRLILELLEPGEREHLLDAGCGTGVFTLEFLSKKTHVTGLDISRPMLGLAINKTGYYFDAIQGDMMDLPFKDNAFDKAVSITALEFIKDAQKAILELFRVTRPGGLVVVATLNSLSPWAARRNAKTLRGQRHILENAFYRSPQEVLSLSTLKGTAKTAIYFQKDDDPRKIAEIELTGQARGLNNGAFLAVCWKKPADGSC